MIGRKMIGGSDRTWLLYPSSNDVPELHKKKTKKKKKKQKKKTTTWLISFC